VNDVRKGEDKTVVHTAWYCDLGPKWGRKRKESTSSITTACI